MSPLQIFGRWLHARWRGDANRGRRRSRNLWISPAIGLETRRLLSRTPFVIGTTDAGPRELSGVLRSPASGPRPPLPDTTVTRDISYNGGLSRADRLDLYVPSTPAPAGGWPVIVAIHGGGWRRLDKADYGWRVASAFVPEGFAVVAPNYPLSTRLRPSWPANINALNSALSWISTRARANHFDLSRVAAMGESAGANLANLLGEQTASGTGSSAHRASISAVVGFSGPSDLASLYVQSSDAGRAVAQELGGPPATMPAAYASASPVNQVTPNSAPTFLVHGLSDPLVPASQSVELAAALAANGVRHQLVLLPAAGHDLNFPIGTPRDLVDQILEFLNATWNHDKNRSLKY